MILPYFNLFNEAASCFHSRDYFVYIICAFCNVALPQNNNELSLKYSVSWTITRVNLREAFQWGGDSPSVLHEEWDNKILRLKLFIREAGEKCWLLAACDMWGEERRGRGIGAGLVQQMLQGWCGLSLMVVLHAVRASSCAGGVQVPFWKFSPEAVTHRTEDVCVPRSHHNHAEFWPGEAEGVYTVCYCYRPGTGTADRRLSGHRPYCWHQRQRSQVWEQSLSVWVFLNYLSQYHNMNLFSSSL